MEIVYGIDISNPVFYLPFYCIQLFSVLMVACVLVGPFPGRDMPNFSQSMPRLTTGLASMVGFGLNELVG